MYTLLPTGHGLKEDIIKKMIITIITLSAETLKYDINCNVHFNYYKLLSQSSETQFR